VTTHQYCTFVVDDSLYGISVEYVQELLRNQRMTPIPLAPPAVCGLINLRGQIVPAIDARERLHLPPREGASDDGFWPSDVPPPMNVVVRTPRGSVALVVDSIGDVLEVSEDHFEEIPDTVQRAGKEFILAACKLENRLLFILDAFGLTGTSSDTGLSPLH
jgi:purine-binding chemotaxis protein CheW